MTDSSIETTEKTEDGAHVPWWNIESPLRRRIKGRYVRSAILVACIANVALVAYAPRLMAPDEAFVRAADEPSVPGLRPALSASPSARAEARTEARMEALARLAALAP